MPLALSVLPSKPLDQALVAEIGADVDVVAQVALGETVMFARCAILVACGLLAAVAFMVAMERVGSSRVGVIALFGISGAWFVASMAGYVLGQILEEYSSVSFGSAQVAFFIVAIASGFAALRIRERGPASHGAFVIPIIGIVMAWLMACDAALGTDDGLTSALLVGSRSRMLLDQHLLEASQNFAAIAWIAAGPLIALVAAGLIRLLFARRVAVEPNYRGLGVGLLLLVTAATIGGLPHTNFADAMRDNASSWTTNDHFSRR